jgi:error-prone DNA polymerase
MPMGFYQPAQIVIDAQNHGVEVREVDINHSDWDYTLEKSENRYHALRLGFRQVKGLRQNDIDILTSKRTHRYNSVDDLRKAGVPENALEKLADADAFRSIGLDRRQALWEVSTKDRNIVMFEGIPVKEKNIELPNMKTSEHVVHDYATTSLSLKAHPVSFVREKLSMLHITSTKDLAKKKDGDYVKVSGLVLVRQRPGTAGGICFMTIEDETGHSNIVIFEKLFEEFRKEILQSKLIMVEGKLQIEGEVIHVIAKRIHNFSKLLRALTEEDSNKLPLLTLSRADEKSLPPGVKVFPEARNFR